jgi:predicted patatin/cPLA2 family phospholipase
MESKVTRHKEVSGHLRVMLKGVVRAAAFAVALAGCTGTVDRVAVPQPLAEEASVDGLRDIRFWGDAAPANMKQMLGQKFRQTKRYRPHLVQDEKGSAFDYLALSGGGGDGAFGAGLLTGWTESGTRPEFDLVTGVSAGALIAPFAFLGSNYDRQLQEIYTVYSTEELVRPQVLKGLLGGQSLYDISGLENLITHYVDDPLIAAIAREYRKGRWLLIATSNLDAQRPMIWNIGAIAASGRPDSVKLIRRVLLASAAIPGVFPPVMIKVTADGKPYQEMHVDGGALGQVFFLPEGIIATAAEYGIAFRGRLYVIRNGKLTPDWKQTEAGTLNIAQRSISTLIKSQGAADVSKLHSLARRNNLEFSLAYIPPAFDKVANDDFDLKYMRELFGVGREQGRTGSAWNKELPPNLVQ